MSLLSLRPEVEALREKLKIFVEEECIPAEEEYEEHMKGRSGGERWTAEAIPPVIERLKVRARELGFWNLFLPHPLPATVSSPSREPTMYLSNREYGILCEIMGRSTLAPEACNCNAPDTGNVSLTNVEVDASALILGEGRGFEIAQSRLGPGRIHHCMRAVGLAARCYELMLQRSLSRKTFGKFLAEHGSCQEMISDSAADLEAARLLTLSCAAAIDEKGPKGARDKIASIKVSVPELTSRVVDRAVQVFGGAGVCQDFPLARALTGLRTLRIVDGPDAVHRRTVARIEIKKTLKEDGHRHQRKKQALIRQFYHACSLS